MFDLSRKKVFLVSSFLLVTVLFPLFLCSPLPLGDYANHLARMHIIAALPQDPTLAQFYEIHWSFIPNLAVDLLVPPLVPFFGLENALLLFTAITLMLIATGALALHRTLYGVYSSMPFLVFLLLYNRQFMWGFLNYLFAVGLLLWMLAFWIRLRSRRCLWVPLAFAIPTAVLFICHLHAFAEYATCVMCVELTDLRKNKKMGNGRWRDVFVVSLQFVLPISLMLIFSPTMQRGGDVAFGSLMDKLAGSVEAFNNYNLMLDGVTASVFFGFLAWVLVTKRARCHFLLRPAVLLLAGLYCVMPNVLFSSFGADRRLLIVVLILFLASMEWTAKASYKVKGSAAAIALVFFAVRMVVITANWQDAAQTYSRIAAGFDHITRGSRMACLVGEPSEPFLRNPPLDHICNMAVISKGVFVNSLFAELGKQILRVTYNDDIEFNKSESQEFRFPVAEIDRAPLRGVLATVPLERFDWVFVIHERFFGHLRPPELELVWRDEKDDAALYRIRGPSPAEVPRFSRLPPSL